MKNKARDIIRLSKKSREVTQFNYQSVMQMMSDLASILL